MFPPTFAEVDMFRILLVVYCFFLFLLGCIFALSLIVRNGVLVKSNGEETHNTLVPFVFNFQLRYKSRVSLEFEQEVEPGVLLLNRVSQFALSPIVLVNNYGTVVGEEFTILCNRFIYLLLKQYRSQDDNGFILFFHFNWFFSF